MSAKTTRNRKTAKEEAKTEATQGCPCMPSGESPSCCGPEMKEMMSRFITRFQEAEAARA